MKKLGYRNESLYGSGVRNANKVIEFEIKELGNTDIISFLQQNHGILQDFLQEEDKDDEDFFYMIDENFPHIRDEIKSFFKEKLGTKNPSALWLTDSKNIHFYLDKGETWVDVYEIKDTIVISNLGKEGSLYVSGKQLECVDSILVSK